MGKNKDLKKLRQLAEGLGLTKLPTTVLYGRPSRVDRITRFGEDVLSLISGIYAKMKIPDIIVALTKYCKETLNDPSFKQAGPSAGRTSRTSYLAPESNVYIELVNKIAGVLALRASNLVTEITIYANNEKYITEIANVVNRLFKDGILANMIWDKVEDKFNVNRDDCIATWKSLLA